VPVDLTSCGGDRSEKKTVLLKRVIQCTTGLNKNKTLKGHVYERKNRVGASSKRREQANRREFKNRRKGV